MRQLLAGLMLVGLSACDNGASFPETADAPSEFTTDAPLELRLTANDDGSLKQMTLNQQPFGKDSKAFQKLESTAIELAKSGDEDNAHPAQVYITADESLRFESVYNAIRVCAGREDKKSRQWNSRINYFRLMTPGPDGTAAVPHGPFIHIPNGVSHSGDICLPDIRVRLFANEDGSLKMINFGTTELGNNKEAFVRLNDEILRVIGRPGNPLTRDLAVEIDCDRKLQYRYVV